MSGQRDKGQGDKVTREWVDKYKQGEKERVDKVMSDEMVKDKEGVRQDSVRR